MPGWPSLGRDDDKRLAQSLRVGDADALAHVYDTYAGRLYDYCYALLSDPADAADALHDALIAAQEHVARLREPEYFRGWLYAIARNECLRQLNDPAPRGAPREAPEVDDALLTAEEMIQRHETRELVQSALAGLTGRQREAVDLVTRHSLDTQELSGVLEVSDAAAAELLEAGRAQLDSALAAALIARSARLGQSECPSVAALVDTGEWPLSPSLCKKLVRHIEACPACGEHRESQASTTRYLHVLPVVAPPADLRPHVLMSASAGDFTEERAAIAQRAEPFDASGWPRSIDGETPATAAPHSTPRLWPALVAAACVVLVVGAVFLYLPHASDDKASGAQDAAGASGSPAVSSEAGGLPTDVPTTPVTPTRSPSPRPSATKPTVKPTTPKPVPGYLSVSGTSLSRGSSGTVSATARGGQVYWSASAGPYLQVTSKSSGRLAPGGRASVTVQLDRAMACASGETRSTVSFSPNGVANVSWTCPNN